MDLAEQATTTPGVTLGMLGIPAGTDFADGKITGSKTTYGFHVGVIVKPHENAILPAALEYQKRVAEDAVQRVKSLLREEFITDSLPNFFKSIFQLEISFDELNRMYNEYKVNLTK